MKPPTLTGKVALAYVLPDQVIRGIPVKGAERIIGAVTAVKDLPSVQPGNVPNKLLTIRGQSGRVAEVDMIRHAVQLFDDWQSAQEAMKQP